MPRNRRQVRQDFANSLRHYAIKSRLNTPDTLGSAVRLVAHLGGYRGRTHDPEPGNQIMWQGYSTLTKATIGHEFGFEDGKRYMLEQVQKYVVSTDLWLLGRPRHDRRGSVYLLVSVP